MWGAPPRQELAGAHYPSQSLLPCGLSLGDHWGLPAYKVHDSGLVPLPMARFLDAVK